MKIFWKNKLSLKKKTRTLTTELGALEKGSLSAISKIFECIFLFPHWKVIRKQIKIIRQLPN